MRKRKAKIGVIGTGGRGMFFAKFVMKHNDVAEVTALCDSNSLRAKAAQKSLELDTFVTTDYKDVLERQDVEAVVITTPDFTHEEIAVLVAPYQPASIVGKRQLAHRKPIGAGQDLVGDPARGGALSEFVHLGGILIGHLHSR